RRHDLTETTRELIKDGTDDIKALSTFPLPPATESNRSRLSAARLTQSKLQKDFQSAALSFQRVQKESVKKSKEALESERAKERERQARSSNSALAGSPLVELDSSSTTAQSSTNLQHQLQSLKQSGPTQAELEYQESLIASREAEIREIESGVQELNEIFRDLGNIVQEQGGMIDNIEFNVTSIATNTEGAERELVVAHEYQRKAGRRAACLLLVVGFVIAIVLVAVSHALFFVLPFSCLFFTFVLSGGPLGLPPVLPPEATPQG
ncbi:t-SNARE, partial [Violaceomyces palustris]